MSATPKLEGSPFVAQPYPLFLADWNGGDPLIGRIVGWAETGIVPEPVVVFEQDGQSWLPIRVNMPTTHVKSGPVWIRGSFEEAKAEADAYTERTSRDK